MTKIDAIQYGKYQHYKNEKLYEIIGIALHSETYEEMIVYKALYESEKYALNQVWVRPRSMFFEQVIHNGCKVPRFKWVSE
jgi:hypothetical protein